MGWENGMMLLKKLSNKSLDQASSKNKNWFQLPSICWRNFVQSETSTETVEEMFFFLQRQTMKKKISEIQYKYVLKKTFKW